jgi:hypothetical protein
MFNECTSLIIAPQLPAINLTGLCYSFMFYNCTSLIKAPDLLAPEVGSSSYVSIFEGCTNLKYVKAMFTKTYYGNFDLFNWLPNASSSATIIMDKTATWYANSVPEGWTIIYI